MPRPPPAHLLKLFFSNKYSYAQILRTSDGHIVASASTIERAQRQSLANTADKAASAVIGRILAERAGKASVSQVHWDRRHGEKYHGKIKELLDAVQQGGVKLH
ncbi:hypothetical protein WJX73_000835 [Symbiochloris irregularis]|uniref:50S ribosomal protein L18 n=1 Tax=Symbiochloris irregularis TaxID=706552 RepID=A0AAW1NQR5_9CHLO